jgi:hypothetical protein
MVDYFAYKGTEMMLIRKFFHIISSPRRSFSLIVFSLFRLTYGLQGKNTQESSHFKQSFAKFVLYSRFNK